MRLLQTCAAIDHGTADLLDVLFLNPAMQQGKKTCLKLETRLIQAQNFRRVLFLGVVGLMALKPA